MKKYLAPSYDGKPNPPSRPSNPDECEIRGCDSLIVGRNRQGQLIRKCGKADIFVDDQIGQKRGVCEYHYLEIAVPDPYFDPTKAVEMTPRGRAEIAAYIASISKSLGLGVKKSEPRMLPPRPMEEAPPQWEDCPW